MSKRYDLKIYTNTDPPYNEHQVRDELPEVGDVIEVENGRMVRVDEVSEAGPADDDFEYYSIFCSIVESEEG